MSTKQTATNSFGKGLVTDLHPLIAPDDLLTDCINGTIITRHGNEYTLQNDLGNINTESMLRSGFKPIASCSRDGIWYIVSVGEDSDGKLCTEIGSYPSPAVNHMSDDIKTIEIILLEFDEDRVYTLEDIKQLLKNNSIAISKDTYYAIESAQLPEFISTTFKHSYSGKVIKPNDVVETSDFIENLNNAQIIWSTTIVDDLKLEIDPQLYLINDLLYGQVAIKCPINFKTSVLQYSVYIDDILIGTISTNINNSFLETIYLNGITANNTFNLSVVATIQDCNLQVQYPQIILEYDKSQLSTNNINAFSTYYYTVSDLSTSVSFGIEAHDLLIPDSVPYTIYDVVFTSDSYTLTPVENGNVTNNNQLFSFSTSSLIKDHLYLLEINVNDQIYKRPLITSTAFNEFSNPLDSILDFSKIPASEWLPNVMLDSINLTGGYGESSTELTTNNGPIYRKYVPKFDINGVEQSDSHEMFKAHYIPNVAASAFNEDLYPSCGVQTNVPLILDDSFKSLNSPFLIKAKGTSEIFLGNNVSVAKGGGDTLFENMENPILHKESGYKLILDFEDMGLQTVYERKYAKVFDNCVEFKFDVDSEIYTIEGDSGENVECVAHYMSIDSDVRHLNYLKGIVNASDNATMASIINGSLLNTKYRKLPSELGYTWNDDNSDENKRLYELFNKLDNIEILDTREMDTVLYKLFLNYNSSNALFIPVKFVINPEQLIIALKNAEFNDSTYYGILYVIKTDDGFSATLVKIEDQHLISDEDAVINLANAYNQHLYRQCESVTFQMYKLLASDPIKYETSGTLDKVGNLSLNLSSYTINGVDSTIASKLMENEIDTTNFKIVETTILNIPLNISIQSYSRSSSNENLSKIYSELLEFKDFINSRSGKESSGNILTNYDSWLIANNKPTNNDLLNYLTFLNENIYFDDYQFYKKDNFTDQLSLISHSVNGFGSLPTSIYKICDVDFNNSLNVSNIDGGNIYSLYQISTGFDDYLKHYNYENN